MSKRSGTAKTPTDLPPLIQFALVALYLDLHSGRSVLHTVPTFLVMTSRIRTRQSTPHGFARGGHLYGRSFRLLRRRNFHLQAVRDHASGLPHRRRSDPGNDRPRYAARSLSPVRETPGEAEEGAEKDDVGIIPLGIPMLAGPGSISTVMVLGTQAATGRTPALSSSR